MKTENDFVQATDRLPEHDELARVNCEDAGKPGHYFCGWCDRCNKPRFFCGHYAMHARA